MILDKNLFTNSFRNYIDFELGKEGRGSSLASFFYEKEEVKGGVGGTEKIS
jgi:hypothetical protein